MKRFLIRMLPIHFSRMSAAQLLPPRFACRRLRPDVQRRALRRRCAVQA